MEDHFPNASTLLEFLDNALRCQAAGDHHRRQAGTGAGAGAGKIQVGVARVAVARAEVAELGQVVAQAVGGAFHQVVPLAPGEGSEIAFEQDVLLKIGDPEQRQPAIDMLARPVADLFPILLAVFAHVADRYVGDQRILPGRRVGWV